MAKIHLMGYDDSLKHRVRNDLESEEFPEYLMVDVPDKLPKRSVTKKLSQAEARLERFKNANAKRSNMPKHYSTTSNASVAKKRSEQMLPARPNSRYTFSLRDLRLITYSGKTYSNNNYDLVYSIKHCPLSDKSRNSTLKAKPYKDYYKIILVLFSVD